MDKKEALKIVKKDGRELEKLSTHFKKDRKIVLEAVNSKSKGFGYGLPLKYADKSLRKDRQIVLVAVKRHGGALEYADKIFRKDRAVVLTAVKNWGYALKYVHNSFKKDREIVLTAIKSKSKMYLSPSPFFFPCNQFPR